MPAAVVGRQVEIVEFFCKVLFAPAPVQSEVLHQKTGGDHAQPVVHVAGLVDLRHRRIDQGVAGAALAPGLKQRCGGSALFPGDHVVRRFEGARGNMRKIAQDLRVKISPYQLAEPDRRAGAALTRSLQRRACQPTNGHRTKAQVHPKVTGAFDSWEIARGVILVDTRKKIVKQPQAATAASCDVERREIGRGKPHVRQGGHRRAENLGSRCQRASVARHRVGLEVEAVHFFKPGVLVRREDAVRLATQRQDFRAFKNHVVLEAVKSLALQRQCSGHFGVARQRLGFIVVIGEHGICRQRLGQRGHSLRRPGMLDDQAGVGHAMLHRQLAQLLVQIHQRLPDELHPAVCAWQ